MLLLSRFNWHNRVGAFRGAVWLHVLVILAAGATVRWPLLALEPFFTADSQCCYYRYAVYQLLAGQAFDSGLHYPPGYAVFLAGVLRLADLDTAVVPFVQHGLGLASSLLVYFLGRRLFGSLVGLAAALLTVLDSELAMYEHAVMTEALFTFLLVYAIGLLVFDMARYPWQTAAGFGFLMGLATLVRPVSLPLPLVLVLAPAALSFSKRIRLTGVAVASAAVILLPVMLWNACTYGLFGLTTSLQRNMLYPIEAAPERLLAKQGSGESLLGQVKATISHHPRPAWGGPYGRVAERFHLSNARLDRLLTRVARDFVLTDPWGYLEHTLQQTSVLLTTGEETAINLVEWSERQYALAGGAAALGVVDYDAAANRVTAQNFDAATRLLRFGPYAWLIIALAALGGTRYYGRSTLLVAIILAITIVSAGTINDIVVRYRYPVTWAIYLLAAAGAAGLFGTLRATLTSPAGHWHGLWPMPPVWPTIRRGQMPLLIALSTTVVVLAALAAGHHAFTHRSLVVQPPAALGSTEPLLSAQFARLAGHLPAVQPVPRLVKLSLPAHLSFDLIGPDGLLPDGQPDYPLLLTVGPEIQGQVLQFVELGSAHKPIWDTTGWYEPLRVIRVDDGADVSQHTDPHRAPQLRPGDRLLVLASVPQQPVASDQCGDLRLHLGNGIVLSYAVEPEPYAVSPQHAAMAPAQRLVQGCLHSPEPSPRKQPASSYRGVSLGGREDNADIRAWIDRFGSLGHGAASYDQWLNNARPRDSSGQPRIFYRGVLLDVHEWSEASAGCSSTMTDILGALFKGWT